MTGQVDQDELAALMHEIGVLARRAARVLATTPDARKSEALRAAAEALLASEGVILAANAADVAEAEARGTKGSFLDRLRLDPVRLKGIAEAVADIAALPDPVGRVLATWQQPNGLRFERVATPLGVIGVIFESRPNVTADAGALCLKSGNASILRAGSESFRTSEAIAHALQDGLRAARLPEDAIQLVPTRDRATVGHMLTGLEGAIDVIVPRGGKSLVGRVQAEARVPVFAHLEGICHVFIDRDADLAMARTIVLNSKLRRTGVCGSAETLLVDEAVASSHLAPYLDAIIAVRVVKDVDAAIEHIATYGSHHTESIVTANAATAQRFLDQVDSAIVLHNASTQFADGGEFGFGAEIGIATGRMHARGPVGVEQLTTFKYRVHGDGQIRP